ncbi:unnamed protein product [Mytilus coruscus]|uniref:Peptidase A2 domain-containing protein n=1 Tax=Mytilus coruscus TaxID=42192 RepID=A0A6J8A058_MYTCO|nr:unnamed protein product [Mytilus coruscus]
MARNFNSKPKVNEVQMERNSTFKGNKIVRARNSNVQNRNIETCHEHKPLENISENKTKSEADQVETFEINVAGNPNSCLIKIAHMKVRSLIDSGALVSLLSNKIYNSIKGLPKLEKRKVNLQGVNRASLNVLGSINLDFNMKGNKMNHTFYVVSDMNRNAILGRDCSKSFEISPITQGHLSSQQGLMVATSVANINEKRQMPVLIVNTTNRTYKFRRGISIGRASPVLE